MEPEKKTSFEQKLPTSEGELAELRHIAHMYHARGRAREAADILELIEKLKVTRGHDSGGV